LLSSSFSSFTNAEYDRFSTASLITRSIRISDAGRQHDGIYTICHADYHKLFDDLDNVYLHPPRFGFGTENYGSSGNRAFYYRPPSSQGDQSGKQGDMWN
jgi:hypothetical protein